jgi:signal transduction histidine kinase
MFFWISHEKSARMELEMRTMLAEMSARLRKSALPPRFYDTPHHWEQLVNMVDQTLSLTRLIFLERVEADHRVREIQALRCSLDSIDERRRDYERTPYSTAIAVGGPIRIEQNYLSKSDLQTEEQYLVPLIYSGEILGFWAFGVDMAKIQSRQQMESMAKDFGYQIAELLYHRRHWLNKEAEEARIFSQYLRLQGGEVVHKDVHQAMDLMERRLSVQQSVFDGLETATVLYDLFGRVMQINRHLEQLMADAGIPAFDYTALELMSALTDFDREKCQELLRQVIMERTSLVVPARLNALPSRRFLLRIQALNHDETSVQTAVESTPFELLGVLFELDDVSSIYRLYNHKEKLIRHLGERIGRGLDEATLLGDRAVASGRSHLTAELLDLIKNENRMLKEGSAFLNKEIGTMPLQLYPIDGRQPILENIEAIREHAEVSDIRIVAEMPEELSLVMAEPEQLHEVTASVLDALINDASEESTIHIVVDKQGEWIRYRFYNQGFGMPNDRFQEFLFEDDGITEGYTQLRIALRRVQSWGGVVEASSELGVGTNIEIKLRAFG